jgi:hypothetical protein
MRVDKILDDGQKEQFYRGDSSKVSNEISKYAQTEPTSSYAGLGLNKTPSTTKIKTESLDDFLEKEKKSSNKNIESIQEIEQVFKAPPSIKVNETQQNTYDFESKVQMLEEKISSLMRMNQEYLQTTHSQFDLARRKLMSYGLSHFCAKKLVDNAFFELRNSQKVGLETILDFIYQDMASMIQLGGSDFTGKSKAGTNIKIIVSSGFSGQSSISQKLASSFENGKLIKIVDQSEKPKDFAESFVDCEVLKVSEIREIFAAVEKLKSSKANVIIDFSMKNHDLLELKKLKNGLFNYSENVEVILSLSSIHSEEYNRKEIEKFRMHLDGLIFNFLDACSNFSSIFNVHVEAGIPLDCFGTGNITPSDIEIATVERVLGGIIEL